MLFLWLPTPSSWLLSTNRVVTGRLRVWLNGATVSHVGHVAEGLGKMKLQSEWEQIPREKWPKSFLKGLTSHSRTPVAIETYLRCREQVPQPDYWDVLGDMALGAWQKRS